jgi:hypothetical protein
MASRITWSQPKGECGIKGTPDTVADVIRLSQVARPAQSKLSRAHGTHGGITDGCRTVGPDRDFVR